MAEADPQKTFNLQEAKTHFSRLVDRAHAGEEIIVAKAGEPWAKLVPIEPVSRPKRQPLLPITNRHTLEGAYLQGSNKDPFDRMIAGQALCEGMTVVTRDRAIAAFGCETLW